MVIMVCNYNILKRKFRSIKILVKCLSNNNQESSETGIEFLIGGNKRGGNTGVITIGAKCDREGEVIELL
jgi:hypothetical protein